MKQDDITTEWRPILIPAWVRLVPEADIIPKGHPLQDFEIRVQGARYVYLTIDPDKGHTPDVPLIKVGAPMTYYGSFHCEAYKHFIDGPEETT